METKKNSPVEQRVQNLEDRFDNLSSGLSDYILKVTGPSKAGGTGQAAWITLEKRVKMISEKLTQMQGQFRFHHPEGKEENPTEWALYCKLKEKREECEMKLMLGE